MSDPVLEALNRSADECSPEDLDQIIAFLRKSYKANQNGEKPKKDEVSRDQVMSVLKIPQPTISGLKRRV